MKFRVPSALFLFLSVFTFLFTNPAHAQRKPIIKFYSPAGEMNPLSLLVAQRPFVDAKKSGSAKPANNFDSKSVDVFVLERLAFDLINRKRTGAGLAPLVWNDNAAKAARLHSSNMAAYDFFSHTGVDGKMVSDRADSAGIKRWRAIGENIAYNRGYADPSGCAVEKWMLSPGHRANILKNDWTEAGVGVAVTERGTFYYTQIFLVKR